MTPARPATATATYMGVVCTPPWQHGYRHSRIGIRTASWFWREKKKQVGALPPQETPDACRRLTFLHCEFKAIVGGLLNVPTTWALKFGHKLWPLTERRPVLDFINHRGSQAVSLSFVAVILTCIHQTRCNARACSTSHLIPRWSPRSAWTLPRRQPTVHASRQYDSKHCYTHLHTSGSLIGAA